MVSPGSRIGAGQRVSALVLEPVVCAFALVRIGHHGVLNLLVDLLTDTEKEPRLAAVQALAYSATQAAGFLLRLKARIGDKDPEVTSECLGALLKLDLGEAMPFVAEFLESGDEAVREGAVLALGESRRPEAFQILKNFWDVQIGNALKETILVAMSLLRLPTANDFLLSLVADESSAVAAAAVSALAVHRHDTRLRERVEAAVTKTGDAALRAHFEKRFRIGE
jgi:HEAT repeat protein